MNTANLLLKELTGQQIPMNDFLSTQKKNSSRRVKEEMNSPRNIVVDETENVPKNDNKHGEDEISTVEINV